MRSLVLAYPALRLRATVLLNVFNRDIRQIGLRWICPIRSPRPGDLGDFYETIYLGVRAGLVEALWRVKSSCLNPVIWNNFLKAGTIAKLAGWTIATPRPPHAIALAKVKLLPLSAAIVCIYWRSTIDPDGFSLFGRQIAARTTKTTSVGSRSRPVGWN